jgi:hypothetical protein
MLDCSGEVSGEDSVQPPQSQRNRWVQIVSVVQRRSGRNNPPERRPSTSEQLQQQKPPHEGEAPSASGDVLPKVMMDCVLTPEYRRDLSLDSFVYSFGVERSANNAIFY